MRSKQAEWSILPPASRLPGYAAKPSSQPIPVVPKAESTPQPQSRIEPSIPTGLPCVFRTAKCAYSYKFGQAGRVASAHFGHRNALCERAFAQNGQAFALLDQDIEGRHGGAAGLTSPSASRGSA